MCFLEESIFSNPPLDGTYTKKTKIYQEKIVELTLSGIAQQPEISVC